MTNLDRFKSVKQYMIEVHNMEPQYESNYYDETDCRSGYMMALNYTKNGYSLDIEVEDSEIWCTIDYPDWCSEEEDMTFDQLNEAVKKFKRKAKNGPRNSGTSS